MIRATFCAPASAPAPSASRASNTSPMWNGRCRLDPEADGAAARGAVATPRRASAATTPGSAGRDAATRGCDRVIAWEEATRGRATAGAAWTTGGGELGVETTRGCGRTTRVSCAGAAGARTGSAARTLSPPVVVTGGGSATAVPAGGLGSGTAAAGLGSGAGTGGAATAAAAAGAAGTAGASGVAAGAAAGAGAAGPGATGAAPGAAGAAPRAGRNESGSR
jgi:hypothetical protein